MNLLTDREAREALRAALHTRLAEVEKDATLLDWIAINGSFGVDSVSGIVGGNGQRHLAATRKNISFAMEGRKA